MPDFRAIGDTGLLRFHRSLYLSLALACACLAYAEWPFLPEILGLSIGVGVALVIAYRLEGRWSLSLGAANVVGAIIAVLVVGWVVYQVLHPTGTLLRYLPWPSSLLPYLGPLVLIIIPAKMFRPKHVGDYWSLQFVGLMGVGLACALGGDNVICLLTFVYTGAAIRCLVDFQAVASRVDQPRLTPPDEHLGMGWTRSIALALTAAFMAVGLTMAAPRITDAKWEYGGIANRLRTGFNEERPGIDLNVSGELSVSAEEAFTVRVETATGQPKTDLTTSQRWRGTTFNYYDRGKWHNRNWASYSDQRRMGRMVMPKVGPITPFVRPRSPRRGEARASLPDLGPNQFTVTFPYPTKMTNTFFLAEPVWAPLGEPVGTLYRAPLETIGEGGQRHPWAAQPEGDVFPPTISQLPELPVYRQVVAPLPNPNLGLPVAIDSALEVHLTVIRGLPRLRQFSDELLRDLVANGRLVWKGEPAASGQKPQRENHEAIARAFDDYLRTSGDFRYSFTLDRNDIDLDPVEDFVLNLRQGHCNRFSSALALLLRCQGVPTRVVMGFHRAEPQGNGAYVVRQSHAHSWVEAVIHRPAADGSTVCHWLTLDPTPENPSESSTEGVLALLFDSLRIGGGNFVRNYLLDFNADRQREIGTWLLSWSPTEWSTQSGINVAIGTAAGAVACGLIWLLYRHIRRMGDRASHPYAAMVELIRRSGLVAPQPSWTPNELVAQFRRLSESPGATEAAQRIANRHYAVRFAGEPPTHADAADLAIVRQHLAG